MPDNIDLTILRHLQADATISYAALGQAVGLSAGATHERVRKLREAGVIIATTIRIDPLTVDLPVTAFVSVRASTWVGGHDVSQALQAIPEIEEAHVTAGAASLLVKVRAASTTHLQRVLRQVFDIEGVSATESIIVLDTLFERSVAVPRTDD